MWLFKRKKTVTPPESPPEPHPMTISDEVVAEAGQKPQREFVRYEPPPGVIPEDIRCCTGNGLDSLRYTEQPVS